MLEKIKIENLIYEIRGKQVMIDSEYRELNVTTIFMTRW